MLWFALRSLVIFTLAGVITLLIRRRSASLRHLIWLAAFVAVAAMPAFGGIAVQVKVTPPPAIEPVLRPLAPQLNQSPNPDRSPVRVIANTIAPPATPSDDTAPVNSIDPYAIVGALYWIGLIVVAVRYLFALRNLRRAVRHSRLREILAPGIAVRLVENEYLASPATFGWPRATVLLPEESQSWPEERRRAAIAHELAHVERADWVWQCVALGVCAAQWFNPFAWFAATRLRAEAEGAADDSVLRLGLAPSRYAQDLLDVAKGIRKDTVFAVPIARPGGVAARIRAILSPHRDRRPATHPAHLAAGTGTLFAASILGGLGLSAAVSSSPFLLEDPFQTPLRSGIGSFVSEPGSPHVLDDGSFGVYQVQVRPKNGREEGWDSMGIRNFVTETRIPRAPVIPGRKVREVAVACPPTRFLSARVPQGAEVLQLVREKSYGIVTVSFPVDARVSPIELGYPKAPGVAVRHLPVKPVVGPDGKRLSPALAWLAVPNAKKEVQYRVFDESGAPLPVKGQFSRPDDAEHFIAVDAAKRDMITRIEECLLVPDWQTFSPLLLDPAPAQPLRPDAPEPLIALPGGAVLTIVRIENQTPGIPFRSWAADGGAPRQGYDLTSRAWASVFERNYLGRKLTFEILGLPQNGLDPSLSWRLDAPMKSNSSGFGYSGTRREGQVRFDIPPDQKEAVLRLDYAYEPYWEVAVEPIGGPQLHATAKVSKDMSVNGEPTVGVHYTPPSTVEKMDLVLEAFDAKGKKLDLHTSGGPSYDGIKGTYNYRRDAWFRVNSPSKISRLRLKARPYHRVTLPPLPMHPR